MDPEVAPRRTHQAGQSEGTESEGKRQRDRQGKSKGNGCGRMAGREAEVVGCGDQGLDTHGKLGAGPADASLQGLNGEVRSGQGERRLRNAGKEEQKCQGDHNRSITQVGQGVHGAIQRVASAEHDRVQQSFVVLAQPQHPPCHAVEVRPLSCRAHQGCVTILHRLQCQLSR